MREAFQKVKREKLLTLPSQNLISRRLVEMLKSSGLILGHMDGSNPTQGHDRRMLKIDTHNGKCGLQSAAKMWRYWDSV